MMLVTSAIAQGPPGAPARRGSDCPEPENKLFGYFVRADASSNAGSGQHPNKHEKTCWVAGQSVSGQNSAKDQGKFATMTADFSYSIGPSGINASTHLYGNLNNNNLGSGSGNVILWLAWRDMLTFHSKEMPVLTPKEAWTIGPDQVADKLARSKIGLKVRLLQNPSCAGRTSKFTYLTGVIAEVYPQGGVQGHERNAMGSWGPVRPPGSERPNPLASEADNQILRANACGTGPQDMQIVVVNGWAQPIFLQVQEILNGVLSQPHEPEGHLKVEMSNVRICFDRPAKPKDLTMTSASGGDYWCP
jgi:hypothetical protein